MDISYSHHEFEFTSYNEFSNILMIGLGFIQAQDIDQNLGLITVT